MSNKRNVIQINDYDALQALLSIDPESIDKSLITIRRKVLEKIAKTYIKSFADDLKIIDTFSIENMIAEVLAKMGFMTVLGRVIIPKRVEDRITMLIESKIKNIIDTRVKEEVDKLFTQNFTDKVYSSLDVINKHIEFYTINDNEKIDVIIKNRVNCFVDEIIKTFKIKNDC